VFHSRLEVGALLLPLRLRDWELGPPCDEVIEGSTSADPSGATLRVPATKAPAGVPPASPVATDVTRSVGVFTARATGAADPTAFLAARATGAANTTAFLAVPWMPPTVFCTVPTTACPP